MHYIMSIDQGTTSTTVLLVDEHLHVCSCASREFPQVYPQADWVEHRPDDIWQSVLSAIGEAIARARIDAHDIVALGVTNQRETTVVWDRATSEPVYNAIVWQCRRTAPFCAKLKQDGLEDFIREKTGLLCDPYFSATKIRWILDHTGKRSEAEKGKLAFGTIDSWLVWQLTGRRVHVTDPSNASRTLLMNLSTLDWDDELLSLFDVPKAMLPCIKPNAAIYGRTWKVPGLPDGIPIAGIAGDQQAALFGQCCFDPGEAKCTFGTGAFLLMNTGDKIVRSQHGLLSTCAWRLGNKATYALEGSAFVAGALVQWLRDGLGIIKSSSEIEQLARSVDDECGVVVLPALTGLGAPHWRPEARGLIMGLTRATTRAHIARASLMGIAQQNTDLLEAMVKDLEHPLSMLKVDGGASINNLLMQMQADLLSVNLCRPKCLQTTALGAAMFAGLGVGMFQNIEELSQCAETDATFLPSCSDAWRESRRHAWSVALSFESH